MTAPSGFRQIAGGSSASRHDHLCRAEFLRWLIAEPPRPFAVRRMGQYDPVIAPAGTGFLHLSKTIRGLASARCRHSCSDGGCCGPEARPHPGAPTRVDVAKAMGVAYTPRGG
jgi:hypothetical protein